MKLTISVTSADLTGYLGAASEMNIKIWSIEKTEAIAARMVISAVSYDACCALAEKRGDTLTLLKGLPPNSILRQILSRWVVICAGIILLFLSVFIPGKVFFVKIEGNETVCDEQIILAAEKCGIYFGADRRAIRSVKMKNALLETIPELSWACINTEGCVATICVSENRTEDAGHQGAFGSTIYASKDGVIHGISVYSGFPEVTIGQVVKKGQVLVSGVQKDGYSVAPFKASADVFALTTTDMTASYALERENRTVVHGEHRSASIIFGKKQIKLFKDSRICTHGCDKIQEVKYWLLPGGFTLPVGLAITMCTCYDTAVGEASYEPDALLAQAYMQRYVLEHSAAGRVLRQVHLPTTDTYNNRLSVRFHCVEMIGRERSEEIESSYGKND